MYLHRLRDGKLDLFISSYLEYDQTRTPKPGESKSCSYLGAAVMCGPRGLTLPTRQILYRNNGDGTLADVTER